MLRHMIYTCRLHIHDMIDESIVMVSRDPVKGLFKYLHLPYYFLVIFLL